MKKILLAVLIFILCAPAVAETEEKDFFVCLGRPVSEFKDMFGPVEYYEQYGFEDGVSAYPNGGWDVCVRYTFDGAEEKYGWPDDTVFSITFAASDYVLCGFRTGDSTADAIARALADGWTELEEPQSYDDFSFEKTVDNVKYTLGLSEDHPSEDSLLDCVTITAENMDAAATENGLPN